MLKNEETSEDFGAGMKREVIWKHGMGKTICLFVAGDPEKDCKTYFPAPNLFI